MPHKSATANICTINSPTGHIVRSVCSAKTIVAKTIVALIVIQWKLSRPRCNDSYSFCRTLCYLYSFRSTVTLLGSGPSGSPVSVRYGFLNASKYTVSLKIFLSPITVSHATRTLSTLNLPPLIHTNIIAESLSMFSTLASTAIGSS